MPRHSIQALRAVITTVALLAGAVWPQTIEAQEPGGSAQRTLEGTWLVQVTTLTDCQSRTPLGSFSALLTFAHDGTMTGTTTNLAFAIGQRTTDHGIWSRLGGPLHLSRIERGAPSVHDGAESPYHSGISGWRATARSDDHGHRSLPVHQRRGRPVLRRGWTQVPRGLRDGDRRAIRITRDIEEGACQVHHILFAAAVLAVTVRRVRGRRAFRARRSRDSRRCRRGSRTRGIATTPRRTRHCSPTMATSSTCVGWWWKGRREIERQLTAAYREGLP